MLKILKSLVTFPVGFPLGLSLLLGMLFAGRVARTDRQRGARLFERLATLTRRMPSFESDKKRKSVDHLMLTSLLLRGAPWEQVRPWAAQGHSANAGPKLAFMVYFADENFAQAREAAEDWCRAAEVAVAGREAEMQAFFARHADDLSQQAQNEIWRAARQAELDAWEADPQGRRPGFFALSKRSGARVSAFLNYYNAHLSLRATHWIETRPRSKRRTKTLENERWRVVLFGLPMFGVSEESLRALGMRATKLAAVRRRALGQ